MNITLTTRRERGCIKVAQSVMDMHMEWISFLLFLFFIYYKIKFCNLLLPTCRFMQIWIKLLTMLDTPTCILEACTAYKYTHVMCLQITMSKILSTVINTWIEFSRDPTSRVFLYEFDTYARYIPFLLTCIYRKGSLQE